MAIQAPVTLSSDGFTSETKYRFDVFLSFRGEDTRHSFTVILYDALRRKGINVFIDDKKLGKGEQIAPTLLKAIEKSRISIIVFSTNYGTSTWCLDELAHIIRCKKEKNQVVMPIFYKVNPMEVQYQRNNFGEAMAAHEERFSNDMEKVQTWRSALSEAASLSSAWLYEDGYEFGFIERIVEDTYARLPPKRFHNIDYIVGLEPHIEEVKSHLDETDNSVCMLGIYGTGGIGKTTLAKAIYNSIFYQFEGACFLFDVREESTKYNGLLRLQQTLISEILEEKRMKFHSVEKGKSIIKHRLSNKKVLLVLDDVEEVEQLENLAGACDWFGRGSKIIITTRNKQLLIVRNIKKTSEMKELNERDSLKLFCWHAFRTSQPPKGYRNMSIGVINYAHGLPLALKLVGSTLAHKNLEEWISTLKRYNKVPGRTIHEVMKVSYDCLQDSAKCIFLDIACFFNRKELEFVEEILKACYCGARFYIEVLVDKSLIMVDDNGCLHMHDLIQQMGKEIVWREAPSDPSKRSRLWYYEDVLYVLRKNLGGNNIEGILLDPPQQEEVKWNGLALKKMINLRILFIRNTQFSRSPKYLPNSLRLLDWEGYPSTTLPLDFSPPKLVCFKLYGSIFQLKEPFQKFEYMTYMDFSKCEFITEVPDMSRFQNLKTLTFLRCRNLIKVHDSVGSLCKLVRLNVGECTKLKIFPREINMASLQVLNLTSCKNLHYFPRIVGNMDALKHISADKTAIKELPSSIGNLSGLEYLSVRFCKSLRELPSSLFKLENLENLDLAGIQRPGKKYMKKLVKESQSSVICCTNLENLCLEDCGLLDEDLHVILACFRNVQNIDLSKNYFATLPECTKECTYLKKLEVNNCKRLRDIPELPSQLRNIKAENCTSLSMESSGHLWSQAKKCFLGVIGMPATKFPDWFDYCCQGRTLSFRVHGKNFPRLVVAVESDKAKASHRYFFEVFMRINDRKMPWIQSYASFYGSDAIRDGVVLIFSGDQGHVFLFDLLQNLGEEDWEGLNKSLDLDWNDVDVHVICHPPDISIVKCGAYVDKQRTNMENIRFVSPRLSIKVSTISPLKRKAISSALNESARKLLRNFKAADKGEVNTTKKRGRKRHQVIRSWYKRHFPMRKQFWRFLKTWIHNVWNLILRWTVQKMMPQVIRIRKKYCFKVEQIDSDD
ncbi:TMV resistance protein N-like isoform X2 [Prosopis cineraria]|uniref:TMV resistance protein N-like isoform X2 n=1 Tax=Prosopis cineraria TaxID=364024 RepID=UPI00240F8D7B|nr:TMV resistance protein N-like isoform X2 [Prosopis cineraria]